MPDIEIIGITTCGTYPSWIDHTIGSFYNHVDKVVVINGGYDIGHPEKGALVPLEREHRLIKDIDINNKIVEVIPTQEQIDTIFKTTCKLGKDEFGRSTNMTLATQFADKLPDSGKVRYILKLDSDQILYPIKRKQLVDLANLYPSDALRFAQYADYFNDFEHISGSLPGEFTNDGALFYKSLKEQGYCGQGSPGYLRSEQRPIYDIKTAHMRRLNPPDVDPYEYHFKRMWYHEYGPNSINENEYNKVTGKRMTLEQIGDIAHEKAVSHLRQKGVHINDIAHNIMIPYEPPLICKITPLEYIKKGY